MMADPIQPAERLINRSEITTANIGSTFLV